MLRHSAPLIAALVLLAGPAAAGECVGARNNPAFSASAATGAVDPCTVKARVAAPAAKAGPAARTGASALDVPPPPKARAATTTVDSDGRTVYRSGDTEVRVGGYVRMDLSVRR